MADGFFHKVHVREPVWVDEEENALQGIRFDLHRPPTKYQMREQHIIPTDSASEQPNTCTMTNPQPDTCWAWVVCLACAVSNIIICGIVVSYGVIFPTLLKEFQQGKAMTALVGSLAMLGLGLFGPLTAKVYNQIGPRATVIIGAVICSGSLLVTSQGTNIYFILLTYGVIFGFGSSFMFLTPYLVVPRYFVKRRSLAVGLVSMGPGGGFVMSPIIEAILDRLDWRKTYMVLAGFVALCVPLVCTIQRIPLEKLENNAENVKRTCCEETWSLFRNKRFDILFLSLTLYYVGHYIPPVHMVRYCEDLEIAATQASRLYLYSGLTSMLCRPLVGWLCDIKWIKAIYIYQLVAGINGVAILLLPLARNYFHFVLYFIFYGLADGAIGCASTIAVLSCFTIKRISLGLGLYVFTTAAMAAAGPPLGGLVADEMGSYVPAFYMTGIVILVGASVIFLVPFVKSESQKNVKDSDELLVVEKCTVV